MPDLKALMDGVLAIDPAADAVEYRGTWWTWGDLKFAIDAIDAAAAAAGLDEFGRIGVMLRNRPPQFAALHAVLASGRCLVTLNPAFPDDKLAADIVSLKVPLVLAEAADLDRPAIADALKSAGCAIVALEADLKDGVVVRKARPDGGDLRLAEPGVIIEMLTSGTTGAPKRVPLKRISFEKSFEEAVSFETGRDPDAPARLRSGTQLVSAPLSHIGGVWGAVLPPWSGRKTCLIDKFTVEEFARAMRAHRPKVAGAPPAALRMLLDADLPRDVFASLTALRTGTAPLDPAIVDEFLERYDLPVLQNYGATEFSGSIAGWTLPDFRKFHRQKIGSVGRMGASVDARVVDPDSGNEIPHGQEGVLELRSPQIRTDGVWTRTTDRAVLDADRFLWIKGRADNAIIRGGFKVHPDDVVEALHAHPAIREAAVVGIPDRRLGQVPAAAIMLKSGAAEPPVEALVAFLRERLVAYQIPARFLFVDDVPRTPSLKPALPALRALFTDQGQAA